MSKGPVVVTALNQLPRRFNQERESKRGASRRNASKGRKIGVELMMEAEVMVIGSCTGNLCREKSCGKQQGLIDNSFGDDSDRPNEGNDFDIKTSKMWLPSSLDQFCYAIAREKKLFPPFLSFRIGLIGMDSHIILRSITNTSSKKILRRDP